MKNLGKLRWCINIQQNQGTTRDAAGEPIENWVTVSTQFAEITAVSGREYYHADQVRAHTYYQIRTRYYPVTPDMVITTDCTGAYTENGATRYFNVVDCWSTGEVGMCMEFIILAKENVPRYREA